MGEAKTGRKLGCLGVIGFVVYLVIELFGLTLDFVETDREPWMGLNWQTALIVPIAILTSAFVGARAERLRLRLEQQEILSWLWHLKDEDGTWLFHAVIIIVLALAAGIFDEWLGLIAMMGYMAGTIWAHAKDKPPDAR